MRKVVVKNILLISAFVMINCILVFIENSIKESAFELVSFTLFIALLIGLIFINYNTYKYIKININRILFTILTVAGIFLVSWTLIYFINWYILYPIVS